MVDWIRGVRLHTPKAMSDDFFDGRGAGLRKLTAKLLPEGSLELKSFDALPPSQRAMNRKPRVR